MESLNAIILWFCLNLAACERQEKEPNVLPECFKGGKRCNKQRGGWLKITGLYKPRAGAQSLSNSHWLALRQDVPWRSSSHTHTLFFHEVEPLQLRSSRRWWSTYRLDTDVMHAGVHFTNNSCPVTTLKQQHEVSSWRGWEFLQRGTFWHNPARLWRQTPHLKHKILIF